MFGLGTAEMVLVAVVAAVMGGPLLYARIDRIARGVRWVTQGRRD